MDSTAPYSTAEATPYQVLKQHLLYIVHRGIYIYCRDQINTTNRSHLKDEKVLGLDEDSEGLQSGLVGSWTHHLHTVH